MVTFSRFLAGLTLVFVALQLQACGSCDLLLNIHNGTSVDQTVQVGSPDDSPATFSLRPLQDTTFRSRRYVGTQLSFPTARPDLTYAATETDHWFGMTHTSTIEILPDTLRIIGTAHFVGVRSTK